MNTKQASNKQEKRISDIIGGKKQPNSGATPFMKGDVVNDNWLIECKTSMQPKQSVAIKKEWLEKARQEAFGMGKTNYAIAFDFGDSKDFFIIDKQTFKRLCIESEGN